jgi:hypothetical protein
MGRIYTIEATGDLAQIECWTVEAMKLKIIHTEEDHTGILAD